MISIMKITKYLKLLYVLTLLNLLKPKTYFYVPQALTFRNSVFSPQCIYEFCLDLRTNSNYLSTALNDWFL